MNLKEKAERVWESLASYWDFPKNEDLDSDATKRIHKALREVRREALQEAIDAWATHGGSHGFIDALNKLIDADAKGDADGG